MAMTKPNFYIGVLSVFAIMTLSMLLFAINISDTRDINDKSQDYVTEYSQYIEDSNIEKLEEEVDKRIIVGTNETGESAITDFLANINYYAQRVGRIKGYLDLMYNLPSFVISSLGLPLGAFRHVINILGTIMFISLLIVIIRLIRGS